MSSLVKGKETHIKHGEMLFEIENPRISHENSSYVGNLFQLCGCEIDSKDVKLV